MSYPVRAAVTRRFSLGVPRGIAIVGPAGARSVLYLRSEAGDDPVTHLWRLDPRTGETDRLLDARTLGGAEEDLPAEERARRERVREQAGGVTTYTVDRAGTTVACALGGRLVIADITSATSRTVELEVPVFDPRISPDGRHVAIHHDDGVSVVDLGAPTPSLRRLVEEPGVVWGRAEFIAAEEMGRVRGMWWSPCSTRLAVARVDESDVRRIRLADLARPDREPTEVAYPFAGTPNARVSLAIVDVATGERRALDLAGVAGAEDTEYLARVDWDVEPLLVGVQPRDQRALHVLAFEQGRLRSLRRIAGEPWVELVEGAPAWLGGLLSVEDVEGDGVLRRALCRDGIPLTPPGMEVRGVLAVHRGTSDADVAHGSVLLSVSSEDPTSVHVVIVRFGPDGVDVGAPMVTTPGLHHAVIASDGGGAPEIVVRRVVDLLEDAPRTVVEAGGRQHVLPCVAEAPGVELNLRMLELGPRRLRAALLLPTRQADGPLPVVLDPYGGPHAQRVLSARGAYHGSQWLADHGFAVLIVDGRGTPGRGPAFEHAVHRDLAGLALADQLEALDAAAAHEPSLDLSRVGIRGWSYGGTLAALAALRRPDRIRCAIVGAPVTDWRLYDTHYTERYLGDPEREPEAYLRSAVVGPDGRAVGPEPVAAGAPPAELLVVHGLVDDNVLAAHSLRLTEALHAAGHPFTFLPLTDATHMASDPQVAARLLETQVRFLSRCLAVGAG
jgi:dipeptidyl-peptidase-4